MSVKTITGPKATGETCHIIIETNGQIPFVEGQSYGVIPPVCAAVKGWLAVGERMEEQCGSSGVW